MTAYFSYTRVGRGMIKVRKDGLFTGFLCASTRRTTGLHAARVVTWAGLIDGREIIATTIKGAKAKIAA